MKRGAWLLLAASLAVPAAAQENLVPLTRCNAAWPCNQMFGLRPADTVAFSPYARFGQGNTAAVAGSAGIGAGSEVKLLGSGSMQDFSEQAARIFLKKYPIPAASPAPVTTPKPAEPAASKQ